MTLSGWQFMERVLKTEHYNLVVRDLTIRNTHQKVLKKRSLTSCKMKNKREHYCHNYLNTNYLEAPTASKVPIQ